MGTTRSDLHRLSAHVMARRRFDVSGHFGLRASPAGLATPAFGSDPEVLRLAGTALVREVGVTARIREANGATLCALAEFADVDLAAPFSVGDATPPVGPVDEPLHLPPAELAAITDWFGLGWRVLDNVLSELPDSAEPATIQLWPEHFDVGTSVALESGERVNLGFSGGDAFSAEPYAYVGPSDAERPGDPSYWNAPFGASFVRSPMTEEQDAATFIRRGLDLLAEGVA
jgi:hypothetical protein